MRRKKTYRTWSRWDSVKYFMLRQLYRWFYCPWYDHREKMDSYGVCVNCGRKI